VIAADLAVGKVSGARVYVAGLGVTGPSVVRALLDRGASVVAAEARTGVREQALAAELRDQGAVVELGDVADLPDGVDVVVTSPGWRPDAPLLVAAEDRGVPVWGDVELAWRLRPADQVWLGVTGTNGKTTTVQMLESILQAGGARAVACGNVGLPVIDAVLDPDPYDVLAVEVSSFQLHWMSTARFTAAALLNIAPDHLDWHGSLPAYAAAKASIWRGVRCAVYNADDAFVTELAGHLDRESVQLVGFSLGAPPEGGVGVVDGALVDRSSGATPQELARLTDVRPSAPHNVANALAAAALARAYTSGVGGSATAVPDGLRAFSPGAHRIAEVARVAGVTYVNDSKATNTHAAAASLTAYDDVVWVAGGLAKGATFDDLVLATRPRLRGVVLLGKDRSLIAEALGRHAPEIPVVVVESTDTGAMDSVVTAAAALARPGDTVLLAPACASMDMFASYAARGDAFAAAVHRLAES
jgi:UDP-N-acetylmuramoylalanine--D-glutamate ligase